MEYYLGKPYEKDGGWICVVCEFPSNHIISETMSYKYRDDAIAAANLLLKSVVNNWRSQ